MTIRKVKFSLKQLVKRQLSSGNFNDALNQTLDLLDAIYTYLFRYPWLLDDLNGVIGSHGGPINFTASNPAAAAGVTLLLGGAATVILIREFRKQSEATQAQAGDYQTSYQKIRAGLKPMQRPRLAASSISTETDVDEAKSSKSSNSSGEIEMGSLGSVSPVPEYQDNVEMEEYNAHLKELIQKDPDLSKKYARIAINANDEVEFDIQEDDDLSLWTRIKKKISSLVYSSWVTLAICSLTYWIAWIGCGAITGDFSLFNLSGPGAAAFGVPIAIAALYPLIKIRNWWKNNYGQKIEKKAGGEPVKWEEDPRLVLTAASDLSKLFRKAILAAEKQRLLEELNLKDEAPVAPANSYLSGDEDIHLLGRGKWKKTATTLITTMAGTYVVAQYGAWVITDFLKAAAGVSMEAAGYMLGFGLALMVLSAAYGIYKAYKRYEEVKKYEELVKQQDLKLVKQVSELETVCKAKADKIEALLGEIEKLILLDRDAQQWLRLQSEQIKATTLVDSGAGQEAESTSKWATVKKYGYCFYVFLCGGTTGIMLGRMATIAGSAIFLPVAAAVLSTPWTIGILVILGVAYGLLRAYQHYQANKEAHAKALFEQRKDRFKLLTEQGNVADLHIKLLETKKQELVQQQGLATQSLRSRRPAQGPKVYANDDSCLVSVSGQRAALFTHQGSRDDHDSPSAAVQYEFAVSRFKENP